MAKFTIGELVYRITGDTKNIDKSLKNTEGSIKKFGGFLKKAFAVTAIVATAKKIANLTDTYANVTNKLKLVTKGTDDLNQRQKELFELSQKSRSSFQSTAELYARLSQSTQELNVSNEDLLTVTDTINKAFVVSGASAEEAANAIRQLSQGLAAGALRGDEFNSVAEQAPRLQQAIAASLGVTVGELRDLAAQGAITSKVIIDSLKGQASTINKEFGQITATVGGVGQTIKNALLKTIGGAGEAVLPEIAKIGEAFILLAKDSEALQEVLVTLLKGVVALARGFVNFSAIVKGAGIGVQLGVINFQISKANENFEKTLENARTTFGLASKTNFGEVVKTLKEASKASDDFSASIEERQKAESAKLFLSTLREQIKARRELTKEGVNVSRGFQDVFASIEKLYTETAQKEKSSLKSQAASLEITKKKTAKQKEGATELEQQLEAYEDLIDSQSEFTRRVFAQPSFSEFLEIEEAVKSLEDFNFVVDNFADNITNVLESIGNLQQAIAERRINEIDAQLQAELEAAGVAEETAVEKAERELALAEETGSKEDRDKAKRELKRAKIEEKFAKKKADVEYKAALNAWELQRALAFVLLLQAPLNAYVSTLATPIIGPVLAPINAAIAAAAASIQFAAIEESRPARPAFEFGGVVPGSSFAGDNIDARVNSGEMILNNKQQGNLFNMIDGGAQGRRLYRVVAPKEVLWEEIFQASQNGELFISERAVTAK